MFWDISIVYMHGAKAADTIRYVWASGDRIIGITCSNY